MLQLRRFRLSSGLFSKFKAIRFLLAGRVLYRRLRVIVSKAMFALLAVGVVAAGCSQMAGSSQSGLPKGPQVEAGSKHWFAGRLVGPGPVLTDKFGGPIFGWAIDE